MELDLKEKGALTVEAALVLPISIFTLLIFLFLFQIMSLQSNIQYALTQVASELSQYSYIYEEYADQKEKKEIKNSTLNFNELCNGLLSHAFIQNRVNDYVNVNKKYHSILASSISYSESRILTDGETIDIVAKYQVHIAVPLISVKKFTVIQRVRSRAFIGVLTLGEQSEVSDSNTEIVYITETGTVYHRSLNCTHLLLTIRSCNFSSLSTIRNNSGGKYKPCERCCKEEGTYQNVYITNEGTRYHSKLQCSGLKRTIRSVPIDEVEDKKPCKKCGGT